MIRWGILGPGNIARGFAEDFKHVADARLTAVASRSEQRAAEFAADFHIPHHFGSYQDLLESGEVDVVYIATPHPQHAELCKAAIRCGVAVLCEKPFALNRRQAEEVFALAREHKVFVMEAMWARFNPVMCEVLERVKRGDIGEVQMLRADFGFVTDGGPHNRLLDRNLAGGALLDIGIYPLFLALEVFGEPSRVTSQVQIGESGVDIHEQIQLEFQRGQFASLQASLTCQMPDEAVISGSQGYIKLDSRWFMPRSYQLALTQHSEHGEQEKQISPPMHGVGWCYEVEAVNQCLRHGELQCAQWPWEKTLGLVQVMDQLRADWQLVYPDETCV